MDYETIYHSLMEKAKRENSVYIKGVHERHHILPKSLGGKDSLDNLVNLTFRQHYVAHRLLVKFLSGREKYKMWCALKRFTHASYGERYKIKSCDYETIKRGHAESVSALQLGRKASNEAINAMRQAQRIYFKEHPGHFTGKTHTSETLELMRANNFGDKNPQYGKQRTVEERSKISRAMVGHKKSPETVAKFRARTQSEETRKKISDAAKRQHAARKMGLAVS